MSGRVEGKVALVTGAGTGIGRAVCVRLAEEGADVVATSQTAAHVDETGRLASEASGRDQLGLQLDVADTDAVDRSSRRSRTVRRDRRPLQQRRDRLVHRPSIVQTTNDEWDRLFKVNVTGTFYACRAAIPYMRDGSSIVNMASINSFVAWENDAPYTATKGAVHAAHARARARARGHEIRVNAVCPGVIDTPLNDSFLERAEDPEALQAEYAAASPFERMGTAREVANCVLFLASDEASFVSGSALLVDGATTAR